MAQAGFRVLSHPSDIGIEVWAPSREAAFAEAAMALAQLLGDDGTAAPAEAIAFEVQGHDDEERLYAFLSEVIYQFDGERRYLRAFRLDTPGPDRLAVEARGVPVPAGREVPYPVKAVTFHQMAIAEQGGKWHGRVYFDI